MAQRTTLVGSGAVQCEHFVEIGLYFDESALTVVHQHFKLLFLDYFGPCLVVIEVGLMRDAKVSFGIEGEVSGSEGVEVDCGPDLELLAGTEEGQLGQAGSVLGQLAEELVLQAERPIEVAQVYVGQLACEPHVSGLLRAAFRQSLVDLPNCSFLLHAEDFRH